MIGEGARNRTLRRRRALRAKYGTLYDEVLRILDRHDPVGMTDVPDEYEPEVDTILPRLKHARTPEELRRIIHTEFVKWFDAGTAGPEVNYDGISREIWAVWQRRNRPA